jgi:DNA-3-methyladenine glycosylase II
MIEAATTFLSHLDDDWARLIETIGACTWQPNPTRPPYEALIRAVAYQQLHPKAGDAILARFLALYQNQFPHPQALLETHFDALRACGFSARKIETIQGIALAANNGAVPSLIDTQKMDDELLIKQLTQLKGIGRWTVEMMLMFTLGRMDILAADDYGLALGYQRLKQLPQPPKPKQLAEFGQAWKPYRTIACWYLWRVPK